MLNINKTMDRIKHQRLFQTFVFVFILSASAVCQSAGVFDAYTPASPGIHINLDEPGALEKLLESNPEHYKKIKHITYQISDKEPSEIETWLKVDYGASAVQLSEVSWLTTVPPKKRLDFVLDRVIYRLTITIYSYDADVLKLED